MAKQERSDEETNVDHRWQDLLYEMKGKLGRKPDFQGMLFLIGLQELNQISRTFTKEEKQDLMHIAVCKLLSAEGYYKLSHIDDEGWPHYNLLKEAPNLNLVQQEFMLKKQILLYFEMI